MELIIKNLSKKNNLKINSENSSCSLTINQANKNLKINVLKIGAAGPAGQIDPNFTIDGGIIM